MGGTESRFNGLLVEGNEKEALELWQSHPELQARFRPNLPIKSTRYRDMPLHSAARSDMKKLMQEFLSRGADPRAKNSNGETPLHIVCRSARFSSRTNRLRADQLKLLLDRLSPFEQKVYQDVGNGVLCESGGPADNTGREHHQPEADPYNLALSDKVMALLMTSSGAYHPAGALQSCFPLQNSNTPLHLAAASGLLLCVEVCILRGFSMNVYMSICLAFSCCWHIMPHCFCTT